MKISGDGRREKEKKKEKKRVRERDREGPISIFFSRVASWGTKEQNDALQKNQNKLKETIFLLRTDGVGQRAAADGTSDTIFHY